VGGTFGDPQGFGWVDPTNDSQKVKEFRERQKF